MQLYCKKIIFPFLVIMFFSSIAFGESNLDFFFRNAGQYKDVIVQKVLSADKIILKGKAGEKRETVKFIGLRAPRALRRKKEIKRDSLGIAIKEPVSPLTPIEEKAFEFVKELLEGQHVRLEFDSEKISADHATLAYVFLLEGGTFVNAEILRNGFAHLSIRQPNTKYAKKLRAAYNEAYAEKRGLQGE